MLNGINLVEDFCPVSEFRADINTMIKKTKSTHRPIVLTQHGKTSAVVMDIGDYQRLVYEKQLFDDVNIARQQVKDGKTHTTTDMRSILKKRYANAKG